MAIAEKMVILVGLWRSIIKAKRSRHRWLIDCDRVVDLYYLFKQLIHFVHWKGPQISHVFLVITQDALLAWCYGTFRIGKVSRVTCPHVTTLV